MPHLLAPGPGRYGHAVDKRLRRLDHAIRDMLKNLNSSDPAMEHYVRILSPSGTTGGRPTFPEKLQSLAHRLHLWEIHERGGTWLDTFLNEDGARWAVETVERVIQALNAEPWAK